MSQNRLLGADFLRAAACLLVVLHHLTFRIDMNTAPAPVQPLLGFVHMGSFGVAIFFVLSGFLLARPFWTALDEGRDMPDLRVYGLRRAARILPGFWLALSVSLVLSVLVDGSVLNGTLVGRYVAGLLLVGDWHWLTLFPVDNNGPLWSIGFEVSSYLLLPLCLALLFALAGRLSAWRARLVWCGVIVLVLVVHGLIVAFAPIDEVQRGWQFGQIGGAKEWMPRFNPIGFFAIFALGALAAGVQVRIAARRSLSFDVLGLAAILIGGWVMASHMGGPTEGYAWLGIPYGFPAMPIAVAVALAVLPSSRLAGQALDNGLARFIARISFGIYVWHALIIDLVSRTPFGFQTAGDGGWGNWLVSSGAVFGLIIGVATLSFYGLEQPMIGYGRWLESRLAARAETSAGGITQRESGH